MCLCSASEVDQLIRARRAIARTTEAQPVHKDCSFMHPSAPFMMIANFLLSDFTPENGSTEFWLGSHAQTTSKEQMWRDPLAKVPTCDIHPQFLEERRAVRPPSQVSASYGSVLLRDVRTWHRGMPNPSENDRTMIAVAYQTGWFTRDRRCNMPESSRAFFESGNVPGLFEYHSDEYWNTHCQEYGQDQFQELLYGPNTNGWTVLDYPSPDEKLLHVKPNLAAPGMRDRANGTA